MSGPPTRPWYWCTWRCEHVHDRSESPKNPHGQGLAAATSMKRAGNRTLPSARVTTTSPASMGCRMPCSTEGANSGSSSKNSTPLCANDMAPGRGGEPPPTKPAKLAQWCGAWNGLMPANSGAASRPATEWMTAASSASERDKGARIEGSRDASMVFPEPGGPIMSRP